MKKPRVGFKLVPLLILLIVAGGCAPGVASPQNVAGCPSGTDCSAISLTLTVAAYTPAPGSPGTASGVRLLLGDSQDRQLPCFAPDSTIGPMTCSGLQRHV